MKLAIYLLAVVDHSLNNGTIHWILIVKTQLFIGNQILRDFVLIFDVIFDDLDSILYPFRNEVRVEEVHEPEPEKIEPDGNDSEDG